MNRAIGLCSMLFLLPVCAKLGDLPQSQLTRDDLLILDPGGSALSLSKPRSVALVDGGTMPGSVSFSAIAMKADLHPAETAHVHVDVARCDRAPVDSALSGAVALVAGLGCSQTSVTHLDCILQIDGSAHFDLQATSIAAAGQTIPIRACSALCTSENDACAESHLAILE